MAGDGGQLYHGLNFAAYGGKVNRFDGGGATDDEIVLDEWGLPSNLNPIEAAKYALAVHSPTIQVLLFGNLTGKSLLR